MSSRALTSLGTPAAGEAGPARVTHVPDFYHCYPGETVILHTRVQIVGPLSDLTLRISVPAGLELGAHQSLPEKAGPPPHLEVDGSTTYLVWRLDGQLQAGAQYEYQVEAQVHATERNRLLESRATVTSGDGIVLDEEVLILAVWAKGRYLRYLPELYEQDEFMGRFLMLFESFWAPLETQIDAIHYYFDPMTTPARFLSWLAGWLGLALDGRLSDEQQRRLIRSAIMLHRKRGTKQALQEYLEIYAGGDVRIVEHRASDFYLGPETRLGLGVALGTGHEPHTFTVILQPPPDSPLEAGGKDSRQATQYRQLIESIIQAEKPAHTRYTLRIESASEQEGER
jgi:phage tail-like protein